MSPQDQFTDAEEAYPMPNPGSAEAIKEGCTCPGAGIPYKECPGSWIDENCPLHGQEEQLG